MQKIIHPAAQFSCILKQYPIVAANLCLGSVYRKDYAAVKKVMQRILREGWDRKHLKVLYFEIAEIKYLIM